MPVNPNEAPPGFVAVAASLEREASDGIARCVCCGKPFGRGMFQ